MVLLDNINLNEQVKRAKQWSVVSLDVEIFKGINSFNAPGTNFMQFTESKTD